MIEKRHACLALPLLLAAGSAVASPPGGWGSSRWEGDPVSRWDRPADAVPRQDRSREGKVIVERFVAESPEADALGQGTASVDWTGEGQPGDRQRAIFEAAVIDALAHGGYNTAAPGGTTDQIAELSFERTVVEPEAPPRKPVSGSMTVGMSNRGSMVGMAIMVDKTKPLSALLSTQLSIRIRDRASGKALWEGRATMLTREGDEDWDDQAIAGKLAAGLFDRFPLAGREH